MEVIEAKTTWGRWGKMILLCLLGIIFAPLLLLLGYRRLRSIPEDDPNYRALKYALIYGIVLVVLGFGFLIWTFMPKDAEGVEQVPWLPDIVSNVSYYRFPFHCEIYEFDVTEKNFRIMYAQETLEEVKEPVTIKRYASRMDGAPEEMRTVTVKNGLCCFGKEDYATGVYSKEIVFDRDKGRAYFCSEREE